VFIVSGVANKSSGWILSTLDPITIGGASGTLLDWNAVSGGGGGGASYLPKTDRFTPTTGQTSFTLSETPFAAAIVEMFVNGKSETYFEHFTVVGKTLTWIGPYALQAPNDRVRVSYFYLP
jgi:hypothetical protein